ncbi:MAG TPA: NAD(P)/FAD-dependent oxidoreductase [Candidatus Gallimonas gallistercoris]|uniref:NAD(P)/FAD-dependent oxidoreductase n=1 Tax=Candidatus Gallimonas gallistercoris TaxID=2838602 RepID=A0A9D2KFM1_9FIRM|nr:NAD(P)/FAD-dependent oxidoreductase [Candidatus Gallimonas gallistercoris]
MGRVVVIGGGAAGLMAAYAAGSQGAQVTLLERNEKLGKKIYITGKGRCNLTNDCPPDEFLENVVRGEKFLTGALWSFSPEDMMSLCERFSLPVKVERGNRVFPVSDHASDVTKMLERACLSVGVTIKLQEYVKEIGVLHSTMRDIITQNGVYPCEAVVVATGGLSYPSTGSTGDGLRFAKSLEHKIAPCVPSLVGLNCKGDFSALQGVSLKNVCLFAMRGGKVIFSEQGEMLFTHYGISGPLVLSLSARINRLPFAELSCFIDFKPALDRETLDRRLVRDLSERKNEQMKNVVRGLLPSALCLPVLKEAGIDPFKQANAVTREERGRLLDSLKKFPVVLTSLRGFEEAVVTSGGVELKDVSSKTMESKIAPGVFFAGEVLDVDAYTGGFNLQIAFSTGMTAGIAAARHAGKMGE